MVIGGDMDFMNKIISTVCDYAVDNDLDVDDTLKTVANNILAILEIASFKNWKKTEVDEIVYREEMPGICTRQTAREGDNR